MRTVFQDEAYQDRLLSLLCYNKAALKVCAESLSSEDFKPLKGIPNGQARWILSEVALDYWRTHHHPIQSLLLPETKEYISKAHMGERQAETLLSHAKKILRLKIGATRAAAITEKALRFKSEVKLATGVESLVEAQASGELTPERWAEISSEVLKGSGQLPKISEYLDTAEERIRRRMGQVKRYPLFLIDPLDNLIRGIGRGHLGLLLAPLKRGKSLGLAHLARAYCLQGFNVLYVTLEDPQEDVEDRFDAAISEISVNRLSSQPNTFRKRFERFRRLIQARLRILDGTEGGWTIPKIAQVLRGERDRGFDADVLIIDYDDEITPTRKRDERRHEIADSYRQLRTLVSSEDLIGWTAAQSQRNTEDLKIIGSSKVAEDIGKARKVTLAISIGRGEWGPKSLYLWVAANRIDRMEVGCNIMANKDATMFYDREATLRQLAKEKANLK